MGAGSNPLLDPIWYREASIGDASFTVPAGVGSTLIKAGAGMLSAAVVTAAGTGGNVLFYDSATTNVTGLLPIAAVAGTTADATAVVGKTYAFRIGFVNGLVAVGATNSPQVGGCIL